MIFIYTLKLNLKFHGNNHPLISSFFQFNTINSMLTLNHCASLYLWRRHIKLLNSDLKITISSHGHISKLIYCTLHWNNLFSFQGIFVTTKSHCIDSIHEFILALFLCWLLFSEVSINTKQRNIRDLILCKTENKLFTTKSDRFK